ncbi:MAG: hypothetical protein IH988_09450 [Planctomycetes bacterium]|nr:hypothetical protein [Planctomycetota bacterium]
MPATPGNGRCNGDPIRKLRMPDRLPKGCEIPGRETAPDPGGHLRIQSLLLDSARSGRLRRR